MGTKVTIFLYICKQMTQKQIQQHNKSVMKSIQINLSKSSEDLTGKSKWWGQPDLPDGMSIPMIEYEDGEDDPMTMVCQIRCADLAPIDPDNLLPHEGMLYFFADIDQFVGALHKERFGDEDEEEEPYDEEEEVYDDYEGNGLGEWAEDAFRVLYSPTDQGLEAHTIIGPDGEPYGLPAEKITLKASDNLVDNGFYLLGAPYYEEIREWYPEYVNLLQIDENDDWGMTFYDCGMINFLIKPEDLKARKFENAMVYFHSL